VGRNAIGGNSGLADHGHINNALAMEILDQEELDEVKERRKKHRKGYEMNGVTLADLDDLYRHRDDPIQDVVAMIKRKMHYLGTVFKPLRAQVDMFMQASESPEMQNAAFHAGRMAGLKGADASPPSNVVGEDLQLWLEGQQEGADARAAAKKLRKDEARALSDNLAQALKNGENGLVTDGTGKAGPGVPGIDPNRDPTAVKVGEKAAADFMADNAERLGDNVAPPQPDWTGFHEDANEWTEKQMTAFERWFALVPPTAVVAIDESYPGVITQFMKAKAALGLKDPAAPEAEAQPLSASEAGFVEATPEELEAQNTRRAIKERQTAEVPDADTVKAEADRLKASGFADPKKGRTRAKLPGERS
jgi:hypothetical protein